MVRFNYNGNTVTAELSGEIDHYNASDMRKKIDMTIKERLPEKIILDFEKVSFMDSSGIGLVIGRYRLIDNLGGKIIVKNVSSQIRKIMKMSGIEKIAEII